MMNPNEELFFSFLTKLRPVRYCPYNALITFSYDKPSLLINCFINHFKGQ